MDDREVRVLGQFVPSQWTPETIEAEVRPHLPVCCRCERIGLRIPHARAPQPPADNLAWHQDGSGPLGETRHMVVWASEQPTELQTSTGEFFTGAPCDLVWFDNFTAFHRQPAGTDETRRWFLAVRCSGRIF